MGSLFATCAGIRLAEENGRGRTSSLAALRGEATTVSLIKILARLVDICYASLVVTHGIPLIAMALLLALPFSPFAPTAAADRQSFGLMGFAVMLLMTAVAGIVTTRLMFLKTAAKVATHRTTGKVLHDLRVYYLRYRHRSMQRLIFVKSSRLRPAGKPIGLASFTASWLTYLYSTWPLSFVLLGGVLFASQAAPAEVVDESWSDPKFVEPALLFGVAAVTTAILVELLQEAREWEASRPRLADLHLLLVIMAVSVISQSDLGLAFGSDVHAPPLPPGPMSVALGALLGFFLSMCVDAAQAGFATVVWLLQFRPYTVDERTRMKIQDWVGVLNDNTGSLLVAFHPRGGDQRMIRFEVPRSRVPVEVLADRLVSVIAGQYPGKAIAVSVTWGRGRSVNGLWFQPSGVEKVWSLNILVEDADLTEDFVSKATEECRLAIPRSWRYSDWPADYVDYVDDVLPITGFEVPVEHHLIRNGRRLPVTLEGGDVLTLKAGTRRGVLYTQLA
jgi:hypothetical protein